MHKKFKKKKENPLKGKEYLLNGKNYNFTEKILVIF